MPFCPKCRQEIDELDNFCRSCGKPLKPGTGFWYSHSGIILLMLVLGPFALIPVFLSKTLSTAAKAIYCVVILLFTVYLCYACWQFFVLMQQMFTSPLVMPY